MLKRIVVGLLISMFLVSALGCGSNSQTTSSANYPQKNIDIIVAYKAGGGTDVGARIVAAAAEKKLGKPVMVVNKPGADGELGYTELSKAKPDGYTIGFINLPTFVSLPLERKTKYKKDSVVPILNVVYDPGVLVVKADSQFKTVEDFIKYAKENPEKLTVANNGTGASNHIGAAHLAYAAGIKLTHVPFGGSADLLVALRGSHVDAAVAKISEVANLVKNGELKVLAVYTEKRLKDFPNVPTLTEKGYPIVFGSARALVAPKGTPADIVKKLHDTFKAVMESPEVLDKAKKANLPLEYMSADELKAYMDKDEKYIKEMVPKLKLK